MGSINSSGGCDQEEQLASMFGIVVAVVIVVWKKLFLLKVLLVEVGLEKYMFG